MRLLRRRYLSCLVLTILGALLSSHGVRAEGRPNVLVIVSDDQSWDYDGDGESDIAKFMPATEQHIFKPGTEFTNAYVTTPLCCPSRASIMTGLYASHHKVIGNRVPLKKPTIIPSVQAAGYYTGLIGKYLNSWNGKRRPEFDYWVSFPGGSSTYQNPLLFVQDGHSTHSGYMTDILADFAVDFLDKAATQDKPFFMLFAPNAPHYPASPSVAAGGLYSGLSLYRPPNYAEKDRSDKPLWVRRTRMTKTRMASIDSFRVKQLRCLWSLDQAVDKMIAKLESLSLINNTLIIFISDNGIFQGEHNLVGKEAAYEEAIHVPMAVRFDELGVEPGLNSELVANIDIAPTVYQVAEVSEPREFDGLSLINIMKGEQPGHKDLLIEQWRDKGSRRPIVALHNGRKGMVYIRNKGELDELYDLSSDPFELNNLTRKKLFQSTKQQMRIRLNQLLLKVRGSLSFDVPKGKLKQSGKFSTALSKKTSN